MCNILVNSYFLCEGAYGLVKFVVATIGKPQLMVEETLSLVDDKGGSNICLRLQHRLVWQSNINPF